MKTSMTLLLTISMLSQSVALAGADRTAGIAQGAITDAKAEIAQLKSQLQNLDATLEQTEKEISKSKEFKANRFWTLTATAVGVTLSTAGYLLLQTKMRESGYGLLAASIVSGALAGLGNLSEVGDGTKDLSGVIQDVTLLEQKSLEDATKYEDVMVRVHLIELSIHAKATREALEGYANNQDRSLALKAAAGISQMAGMVGIVMTALGGKSAPFQVGAVLASAGHFARVAAHLSEGDAKTLLESIAETRAVIRTALSELN